MDFKGELRCSACGRPFSVELARIRYRFAHACPFCGDEYVVSENQAIRAHRALDELEHMAKSLKLPYIGGGYLRF
jgi:predicted RNA-binding Zn-ribbon protein involved in translation (DUF1610 family)